jgi:hypothetical protein
VPSDADKQITKKLRTAGDSLEIKVLDHLIVTSLVILVLLTKEYFKINIINYEYKRCLDLDHTLWDFDKIQRLLLRVSFKEIPPLKSKHSLKNMCR